MNLPPMLTSLLSTLFSGNLKQFALGMWGTAQLSKKLLLITFVIASVICSVIGVFIPFVSVRSFGLGGGVVITLIVWYMAYLSLKKANVQ